MPFSSFLTENVDPISPILSFYRNSGKSQISQKNLKNLFYRPKKSPRPVVFWDKESLGPLFFRPKKVSAPLFSERIKVLALLSFGPNKVLAPLFACPAAFKINFAQSLSIKIHRVNSRSKIFHRVSKFTVLTLDQRLGSDPPFTTQVTSSVKIDCGESSSVKIVCSAKVPRWKFPGHRGVPRWILPREKLVRVLVKGVSRIEKVEKPHPLPSSL